MGAPRRPFLAACALVAALGASPVSALSEVGAAQQLPGATLAARVLDLDADGAAELVRLVDAPGAGFEIELWDTDGAEWTVRAAISLMVDPDGEANDPGGEIAALLPWTHDGQDRLLVITARRGPRGEFGGNCCGRVRELAIEAGSLELSAMGMTQDAPQTMSALDLDGDGTDELVVSSPAAAGAEPETDRLVVHGWDDGSWVVADELLLQDQAGWHIAPGVDGGRDAVILGPGPRGEVSRIALADGTIDVQSGHLGIGETFDGWVVSASAERLVLVSSAGVHLADWPWGLPPAVTTHRATNLPSVSTFGSGADMRLLVSDSGFAPSPGPPSLTVLDPDMRPLGRIDPGPSTVGVWEILRPDLNFNDFQRNLFPYFGPLPGLIDGRPGALAGGILIQPGGAAGFDSREVAPLIGLQPIGRVGPEDAWLVLGDGFFGEQTAFLLPFGDISGWTGPMLIAPLEDLLDPTPPPFAMRLVNGIEVGSDEGETEVLAAADGMSVEITAVTGSLVISVRDNRLQAEEITPSAPTVSVDAAPPRARDDDGNLPFERWIAVISPEGRSATIHLRGTFLREDPVVRASASTPMLSLRSAIRGRVTEFATVLVDGAPVATDSDGRFRTEVDAPIWPRDVVVTARDPFGRESTTRIQVVGFLDYRGLPWAAIVGAGILVAGAFLFLRTPARREAVPTAWGDGTLEEFDGD